MVLPTGTGTSRVSIRLTGLTPGSRYVFRVIAVNTGNDFVLARDGAIDMLFGGTGYDRARVDRRIDVTASVTRVL